MQPELGPGRRVWSADSGKHAFQAVFDDASAVAWANKGARIVQKPGIAWAHFRYVLLFYRIAFCNVLLAPLSSDPGYLRTSSSRGPSAPSGR